MSRFAFCLLLLTACSESHDDDDSGTPVGAVLWNDCAPDDGSALRILISSTIDGCETTGTERSIEFYVFSGSDTVFPIEPGNTVTSDNSGAFGNGTATECPGGTPPCRTSQNWTLTFDAFEDDVRAAGSYSIDFDGEAVSGSFDATFCDTTPPTCG